MLQPGDTLELAAGTYPHFTVSDKNGTATQWITITGPTSGAPAIVQADLAPCCNTVEIVRSSYVAIRNLTVDNRSVRGAFAISAKTGPVHHIRIERNRLVFTNAGQQDVGVSTKVATWGWEIRENVIEHAGTGMYLGNSDGSLPFVEGLIERNLLLETVGYNLQIKHQVAWPTTAGLPSGPTRTIIRDNVFIKDNRASPDGDRPNLLVGGWPDTGAGADNLYEIYGNFFFENPREALIQATGSVSIHDNLFAKSTGPAALVLTTHSGKAMKRSFVYHNTFLTPGTAVNFATRASIDDLFTGNLLLAGTAYSGQITNAANNLSVSYVTASSVVRAPVVQLPGIDLYPLPGQATGPAVDLTKVSTDVSAFFDFNATPKGALEHRGAYAGSGTNPGWPLQEAIKAGPPSSQLDGGASDNDAGTSHSDGGASRDAGSNEPTDIGFDAGHHEMQNADAGALAPTTESITGGCGCASTTSMWWLFGSASLLGRWRRARRTSR